MDELLDILNKLHPDVDFRTEEGLIDRGILDSMDIVSLIAEIKDVFDVIITVRYLLPVHFNSAKALYWLIQRMEDED